MYRARDRVVHGAWLEELDRAAGDLDLGAETRSVAEDLFLSGVPEADRSRPASVAASLYAGALIAGEERSQGEVAAAVGVSRLAVQSRWKDVITAAGFEAPGW